MADRTWNAVDARLYEEMWSKEARLIMGVLIARCPNPYGVYEIPYLILTTMFTKDEIRAGLTELANEKAIGLYRDERVVWIIKKWKRAGEPNLNQQKGAYNEVHGRFGEVWKDFNKVYKGFLRGLDGVAKVLPSESDSDTDSDTDSETDTEKKKSPQAGDTKKGNWAVKSFVDKYRTAIDPDYKPSKADIGQINNAFKHVVKSESEFIMRLGFFCDDDWVREKKLGASHFYTNIEKFKTSTKKKRKEILF